MKKIVISLLIIFLIQGFAEAQKPPVYINLVSHNEDSYMQYLNIPTAYYQMRTKMILFAELCQDKGARWNLGTDWILPMAVFRNDTGSVLINTSGKNILRYLNEDLNVSIDAHSHESTYNYTDVWHLLDSLGVNASYIMSGFLVNQDQHGHYWTDYQNIVPGDSFPHVSWQAQYLWGAGTPGHVNDPFYIGIWKPQDTAVNTSFITHDSTKHLINYGQGCKMKLESTTMSIDTLLAPLRDLINAIQNGTLPEDGIYCTSIFFTESSLNLANFNNKAGELMDSINHYVSLGLVEWMKIDSVAYLWDSGNMDPSIHHCSEYYQTRLNDFTEQPSFNIYPNPGKDILNLETECPDTYNLEIYDLEGRLHLELCDLKGGYQVDISKLHTGTFLIQLSNNSFLKILRFIKL